MHKLFLIFAGFLFFLGSCGPGKSSKENDTAVTDTSRVFLERLNKQIAEDGSNPDLFNKRARFYLADKQLEPALKDASKAISLDPKKPDFYITASDVYLMMGQPQKASDVLVRALEKDPSNHEVVLHLARLNLIIREYKTAMQYVNKSLEKEPDNNPQAFFLRALILLETGDTVRAVTDLKKTVELDQNQFDAYMQLGELYAMKKDRIAADYINNALRIRPNSKEALYMLGMFFQDNGMYEQALETYARLEKADSSFRNASYNQGYIYLVYLKDFPKSIKYFTDAINKDPVYAEAWYNRGYAYELSGDHENAYKDYKKTLELRVNYDKAIQALNRIDRGRKK